MYKAVFKFSKTTTRSVERMMISEFMRLRGIAVSELNQYFEIWHGLYAIALDGDGKSDIERYGYTCSEMRTILDKVNRSHFNLLVKLDCDEHGNLIGRNRFDKQLVVTMTLELTEELKES